MAGIILVITGGPNDGKGKNKHVAEYILSVEQEPWAKQEVRFRPTNKAIGFFQNDPLVIKILLSMYEVRRKLVNTGSFINLLILNVFNKLGLDKSNIVKVFYPLVGLRDKNMAVLGNINLPLVLGNEKHKWDLYVEFMVVDILFAYNVILGHSVLNYHGIVINVDAMYLKLPASGRLVVV
ncbi:hypothetical protein MANES_04G060101v8 [Manihot esculenta]|uniref:Uncharacterized protein n=1 Tax=Manihot esculenta TaxID=3983 RepID=A0ACB7HSL8_MANES|nr:hypothetical protein MANES_04G060101v8 [Manihot esculenta]